MPFWLQVGYLVICFVALVNSYGERDPLER